MFEDTIAAISSGMSQSGIGIIRISGNDSFEIAKKVFKKNNGDGFNDFESHRVYHGFVFDENKMIDEVILLPFKAPKSFTGEDTIELQCHGGIFILNKILEIVIKNGSRIADPGEFTKRAFINGRIDLSKAEAVMEVISSRNSYALNNSIKQLRGSLYETILNIRSGILNKTAYIEAALDDPEHYDLNNFSNELNNDIDNWSSILKKLSDSFDDGKLLSEGIKTVILGKPNVGKSSFLNLLCGFDRAIVTDIAGTTRDTLEESVSINGINLNIIDTAGIHDSYDTVEKMGIDKAYNQAKDADLIILIVDGSDKLTNEDLNLFEFIEKNQKNSIVLINKSDLDVITTKETVSKHFSGQIIVFSANSGQGSDEFKDYIKNQFISGILKYNDEIFITNSRQKNALDDSIKSLLQVKISIDNDLPEDFYTIDLSDAYTSLGFIIGEETSDDVINEVFAKFCMGK